MPLDKASLTTALETAFGANETTGASKTSIEQMAADVADAVDTFVKSGTVGTVVTIPVTSAPGTPSTGTGTGSVS